MRVTHKTEAKITFGIKAGKLAEMLESIPDNALVTVKRSNYPGDEVGTFLEFEWVTDESRD